MKFYDIWIFYEDIHNYLVYYNNDRVVDWPGMEHKML